MFVDTLQVTGHSRELFTGSEHPPHRLVTKRFFSFHLKQQISIGNSMICSDIWHKYHEWYFRIIIIEIWDNFETSRVVFMPNITYKSCLSIICLYYYPQNVCNFHM